MKKIIIICLLGSLSITMMAQSVGVGTLTPDASAILDINSLSKGVLIPRMTTAQRQAIVSPATGLIVYDITTQSMWLRKSSVWTPLIDGLTTEVFRNGPDMIYMGLTDSVGVGTMTPARKFQVVTNSAGYGISHKMGATEIATEIQPAEGRIGTVSNDRFALMAGGVVGLKVHANGNVTMGIDFPTNRLNVGGKASISDALIVGGSQFGNASAAVDIQGTTKGLLIPRMTTAQRDDIVAPANGLQIYNLDDFCIDIYDGNDWTKHCGLRQTGVDTAELIIQSGVNAPSFARSRAVAFTIGTKGYMGTGQRAFMNGWTYMNDFWEFNPATNTWTQKASLPGQPRAGAVGFAINGKGYLGTGELAAPNDYINDFWEYNPVSNTWTQKADVASPVDGRANAIGFALGNYGYIGGGFKQSGGYYGDMKFYDPTFNAWNGVNPFPLTGTGFATFVIGNLAYVGLGLLSNTVLDNHLYSFNGGTWTEVSTFPGTVRQLAVGFAIDQRGYVATGKTYGSNYLNDLWRFNPVNTSWEQLPDLGTTERYAGISFVIDDKAYIGTGFLDADSYSNDMFVFEPYPIGPVYENSLVDNAATIIDDIWKKEVDVVSTENRIDIDTYHRTHTPPANSKFYVTGNFKQESNGAEFREDDGTQGIGLGFNTIYAAGSNTTQDLGLAAKGTSGDVFFKTNGAERARITPAGNVGIGTTTPNAPLQFNNIDANRKIVFSETANNDHQYSGLGNNTGSLRYQVDATTSDHVFFAGATSSTSNELMRIKGNGNVGIGITTPQNKLDINSGPARTGSHPTGLPLYVTGIGAPASSGVEFRHDNGTQGIGFGYNTIYAAGTDAIQNLGMQAKGATGNLIFSTNASERLRITGGGNVGIGTTTPNAPLQFATSVANRKIVLYEVANNDHQYHGFGINNDGSLRYQTANTANDHVFFAGVSSTTSNELMRISGVGNVGIGITSPQNKLDIANGAARTGTHATGRPLYITGTLSDASNGVEIRHADGTQGIGFGRNTMYAAGSNADQNLGMAAKGAAGHLLFSTNGTERVRITAGGQVGIGTTTPHAQLQLATSVANRKIVLYEVADNDNQFHGFGIDGFGSLRYQTASTLNDHVFFAATSATTSNELMRIKGDGNVVISGEVVTETFITPTLLNNFTNYGNGHATAAFYKDKMGRVFLRGLVNNVNNPNGLVVFTLPVGYRPSTSGRLVFTTLSNNALGRIDIQANGDVQVTMGTAGWIGLDNISFKAD